jgi:hypothetical protein
MDYTVKLSANDVQLIFQALGELPLKASLNTFGQLQSQVAQQESASTQPSVSTPASE